jgi:hypothetical protein
MYSIEELADDFCRLGIGPDDTVQSLKDDFCR